MEITGKTFSESWYRVKNLKVSLRPTVEVRKRFFRGKKWYVLHDPFNNRFFRLRPEAYEFISHLRQNISVNHVWEESIQKYPDKAPGQEEVIRLLTQLYYSNLLYFKSSPDTEKIFNRYQKRRQREFQSKFLSIMFMRIPLFDPNNLLNIMTPLIKLIVGPLGMMIWMVTVLFAGKICIDHSEMLINNMEGFLSHQNLIFLYIALVIIKSLHEIGHAFACKRFGGEVHTIGVMLLVFTPLPYIDVTSSWRFQKRWQRVLVGAAGIITELFVASLAASFWAYSGPGTLHALSYNIMVIASVFTVLFNANPLLRFDGYYILCDILDIPNLHIQSRKHLQHMIEKYAFGYRYSSTPARNIKEGFWFIFFGLSSGIYKIIVFVTIIFFVADKFLIVGMIIALICIFSWCIVPFYRLLIYLISSPKLAKTRFKAIAVCTGFIIFILIFFSVIPFSNSFKASGIMESATIVSVFNDTAGYVEKVMIPSGSRVDIAMPILKLYDPELNIEIKSMRAQEAEILAIKKRAILMARADLGVIKKRLDTIQFRLKLLQERQSNLIIIAKKSGVWVSPESNELLGTWLSRGRHIGDIIDLEKFRFSAVVTQEESANLFQDKIQNARVRIYGQADQNIDIRQYKIIPFEQTRLPSPALGWHVGGEVPTSLKDQTGLEAAESFFLIDADLIIKKNISFLHGRSGKIRFSLPSETLYEQMSQYLQQLFQKRYHW